MTKEEINLCKQVAKKEWREIERFEKIIHGNHLCTVTKILEHKGFPGSLMGFETSCCSIGFAKKESVIPFWTISDCISWLHKQSYVVKLEVSESSSIKLHHLENRSGSSDYEGYNNKTPLEACLKAVLAVLEEEKK